MKRLMSGLCALLLLMAGLGSAAAQEADTVWELVSGDGRHIAYVCYEPETGDQYISEDNRLYEVVRVEGEKAIAEDKGDMPMPDVSWLDSDAALPVSAMSRRRVALYCTHSDESYEPSDGLYSDDRRGSIYKVAAGLAEELSSLGIEAEAADTLHHPHDAGAYRRSRQTAVELLKTMPDALLDIHRDGIPDPDEYAVTIGGKKASKVRLLVGRGNQNMAANKDFALTVKAVADKVYPGLIKDIYMGKGAFNQDLYPRALLLECGTYTISRDRVMTSMPMMANVLSRALYGGVTGSAGTTDVRGSSGADKGGETQGQPDPTTPATQTSKGAGSGIFWVLGIFVAGLIVYGIAATGSLKGGMHKAGRNLSEMTGGLVGADPKADEEPEGEKKL